MSKNNYCIHFRKLAAESLEFLKHLEKIGRHKEAAEFRAKLKQSMDAKLHLERISKLDFNNPNKELKDSAVKFG